MESPPLATAQRGGPPSGEAVFGYRPGLPQRGCLPETRGPHPPGAWSQVKVLCPRPEQSHGSELSGRRASHERVRQGLRAPPSEPTRQVLSSEVLLWAARAGRTGPNAALGGGGGRGRLVPVHGHPGQLGKAGHHPPLFQLVPDEGQPHGHLVRQGSEGCRKAGWGVSGTHTWTRPANWATGSWGAEWGTGQGTFRPPRAPPRGRQPLRSVHRGLQKWGQGRLVWSEPSARVGGHGGTLGIGAGQVGG